MKKLLLLSFILGFTHSVLGQIKCGYETSDSSESRVYKHIYNGGVFTPKGDLRVLIIFVKYGGVYDTMHVDGWDNGVFPDWANSMTEKAFYNSLSEFSSNIYSDSNRNSVSNFYYQMSQGQFRLVVDYYPQVITLMPTQGERRGDFHKRIIDQIPASFDWTPYDNRTNFPNYGSDNTNSSPDNKVDYIIFCHRFSREWPSFPANWLSEINFDGEASLGFTNPYRISLMGNMFILHGFSFMSGGMNPMIMFPHEAGHEIYSGPHYSGNNSVAGDYFYEPISGYGMMRLDHNYTCATGWERYILNWVPDITANGINTNIATASDMTATGVYILRDFITTGDAIRVRVPAGNDTYQYLWLENHQCKSTFDGNLNKDSFCGTPIDEYKLGLVAYVESYSHVKDIDCNYYNMLTDANGIRWISKNGDYDFGFGYDSINPAALCYHATYPFHRLSTNPIGGQSVGELIRHDFDNDGHIVYNENPLGDIYNRAANECIEVVKLDW